MEQIILSELCNDINKLDVIENKETFINKYKDIGIKINSIDNYLNKPSDDIKSDDSSKKIIDIIIELTNLNTLELNNNITIEKIKYYNDLIKKYEELLINEKNNVEYV
jgi:hypothetical protein